MKGLVLILQKIKCEEGLALKWGKLITILENAIRLSFNDFGLSLKK